MSTTDTAIRLPHTGLRVPDRSLALSAFKQLQTICGVAFTANLRLNNRIVGSVENAGTGGMTMFRPNDWRAFGETHLQAYAESCRTEIDTAVTVEDLLDTLVNEHDTAGLIAAAAKRGKLVLRRLDLAVDGYPAFLDDMLTSPRPLNPATWAALAGELHGPQLKPTDRQWWQAWTGDGWHDVTDRPADIDADLYR